LRTEICRGQFVVAARWGVRGQRQRSPRRLLDRDRARRYIILWLDGVEKVIRPLALLEIDASIGWCYVPTRHTTTTAATTHRFFRFLDDSQQVNGDGFTWLSLTGTYNGLEIATSALIEHDDATAGV
jgi:hypothetical protein